MIAHPGSANTGDIVGLHRPDTGLRTGLRPADTLDYPRLSISHPAPPQPGRIVMMRRTMLCALVAIGIASTATAATRSTRSTAAPSHSSALSPTMIGPQVGFSVNPDQAVVGGHLSTGFAPDWTLNPGVDVGFGDHATVTSLNFDAEYHFHIVGSTWAPYVGGGLGVHFIHVNMDFPFSDFSDTVTGF